MELAERISLSAARPEVVRRQLTTRERAVLDALLSVEFDGVEDPSGQKLSRAKQHDDKTLAALLL